jgi:hypothetical protein
VAFPQQSNRILKLIICIQVLAGHHSGDRVSECLAMLCGSQAREHSAVRNCKRLLAFALCAGVLAACTQTVCPTGKTAGQKYCLAAAKHPPARPGPLVGVGF